MSKSKDKPQVTLPIYCYVCCIRTVTHFLRRVASHNYTCYGVIWITKLAHVSLICVDSFSRPIVILGTKLYSPFAPYFANDFYDWRNTIELNMKFIVLQISRFLFYIFFKMITKNMNNLL